MSSNEVYLLNPFTQTYKILPNMIESRHSHGITLINGSVFVLGGIKHMLFLNSMMKECEKYCFEAEK